MLNEYKYLILPDKTQNRCCNVNRRTNIAFNQKNRENMIYRNEIKQHNKKIDQSPIASLISKTKVIVKSLEKTHDAAKNYLNWG
jgi:hypothetical protein